ncbi:MAG: Gfo/Idh/MocA family oxidoreductase [Oscillospiraceae bacterium]|nr:Gfo/Idh/MocA family oxidoreductase [Oscillospiraceae bacterium]
MVRMGMIGAGYIAEIMSNTVRQMNAAGDHCVELYGIASRSREKAQQFAEDHGIRKAYGSYEDLAADPRIDLAYVAVPHPFHVDAAKLCMEHGKAVLMEKPFAVNAAETRELIRLAKEKKLLITEAMWTRYQPIRKTIYDTVYSGIVGEPKMLQANLGSPNPRTRIHLPELAGGALLDIGVYALNFAEMLFGRAGGVKAVCAKNQNGVDISDTYTMTFSDGKIAVLYASVDVMLENIGMIYCTEGYIRVRNVNNPDAIEIYDRNRRLIRSIESPARLTGYEFEVAETAAALEAGRLECASMPHAETVHIMELADEIRRQMGIVYPFE